MSSPKDQVKKQVRVKAIRPGKKIPKKFVAKAGPASTSAASAAATAIAAPVRASSAASAAARPSSAASAKSDPRFVRGSSAASASPGGARSRPSSASPASKPPSHPLLKNKGKSPQDKDKKDLKEKKGKKETKGLKKTSKNQDKLKEQIPSDNPSSLVHLAKSYQNGPVDIQKTKKGEGEKEEEGKEGVDKRKIYLLYSRAAAAPLTPENRSAIAEAQFELAKAFGREQCRNSYLLDVEIRKFQLPWLKQKMNSAGIDSKRGFSLRLHNLKSLIIHPHLYDVVSLHNEIMEVCKHKQIEIDYNNRFPECSLRAHSWYIPVTDSDAKVDAEYSTYLFTSAAENGHKEAQNYLLLKEIIIAYPDRTQLNYRGQIILGGVQQHFLDFDNINQFNTTLTYKPESLDKESLVKTLLQYAKHRTNPTIHLWLGRFHHLNYQSRKLNNEPQQKILPILELGLNEYQTAANLGNITALCLVGVCLEEKLSLSVQACDIKQLAETETQIEDCYTRASDAGLCFGQYRLAVFLKRKIKKINDILAQKLSNDESKETIELKEQIDSLRAKIFQLLVLANKKINSPIIKSQTLVPHVIPITENFEVDLYFQIALYYLKDPSLYPLGNPSYLENSSDLNDLENIFEYLSSAEQLGHVEAKLKLIKLNLNLAEYFFRNNDMAKARKRLGYIVHEEKIDKSYQSLAYYLYGLTYNIVSLHSDKELREPKELYAPSYGNIKDAKFCFQKAADAEHPFAQHELAKIFLHESILFLASILKGDTEISEFTNALFYDGDFRLCLSEKAKTLLSSVLSEELSTQLANHILQLRRALGYYQKANLLGVALQPWIMPTLINILQPVLNCEKQLLTIVIPTRKNEAFNKLLSVLGNLTKHPHQNIHQSKPLLFPLSEKNEQASVKQALLQKAFEIATEYNAPFRTWPAYHWNDYAARIVSEKYEEFKSCLTVALCLYRIRHPNPEKFPNEKPTFTNIVNLGPIVNLGTDVINHVLSFIIGTNRFLQPKKGPQPKETTQAIAAAPADLPSIKADAVSALVSAPVPAPAPAPLIPAFRAYEQGEDHPLRALKNSSSSSTYKPPGKGLLSLS